MLVFQILPYRGPDGMIHLDQGHLSFCLSWVLKYDSDLPPHSTLSLCFSNLGCKCSPVVLAETPGTSFCVGINHHPVNLPEPQYDAPSQQESGSREVMAATDGGLGPTRNPACSCPEMSPRLAMKVQTAPRGVPCSWPHPGQDSQDVGFQTEASDRSQAGRSRKVLTLTPAPPSNGTSRSVFSSVWASSAGRDQESSQNSPCKLPLTPSLPEHHRLRASTSHWRGDRVHVAAHQWGPLWNTGALCGGKNGAPGTEHCVALL
nr:uncharacterized protein LOC106029182 isoform X1 [Cavia porcellus]